MVACYASLWDYELRPDESEPVEMIYFETGVETQENSHKNTHFLMKNTRFFRSEFQEFFMSQKTDTIAESDIVDIMTLHEANKIRIKRIKILKFIEFFIWQNHQNLKH